MAATTLEPCAIVIFGASGDLTERKLVPALFDLARSGGLPDRFAIVGAARTDLDDGAFREKVRRGIGDAHAAEWDGFARRLFYQPLRYDEPLGYAGLGTRLSALEAELGLPGNRLFNLALPPTLYEVVAAALSEAGLSAEGPGGRPFARLVVEKPFGRDLASARVLDRAIALGFGEHQVFRIDHYMAKETVRNILVFRLANAIFEPIWNRNAVDWVRITATETLGVEHRAGYYETAGVLRDMVQNHLMQLLAVVATEPPGLFEAERVRDERAKLFRSLRPFPALDREHHVVLGQYGPGEVSGLEVPGYREEPGVDPRSLTPTYAAVRVFVDNWRWQGVPFYLETGKRLGEKATRVDVQFKPVPYMVFKDLLGAPVSANRLTLGISPEESIVLTIQAKRPGAQLSLRPARLRVSYYDGADAAGVDAYGKALGDALAGDHTLFWRRDSLELAWAFYDPLINACEACLDRATRLHPYAAGSRGPEAALAMLPPLAEERVGP
jgi:glucose-6-phosphate 1-dehydrogenase